VGRLLRVGRSAYVLTLEGDLDAVAIESLRLDLERLCNSHVIVDLLDVTHVGPETIALLERAGQAGVVSVVADRWASEALQHAESARYLRVHDALSDAVGEALL
jgi:hypothetical protein